MVSPPFLVNHTPLLVLHTHLKMLILPLGMEKSFTVWTNNFILVLSRSYVKQKMLLIEEEYTT